MDAYCSCVQARINILARPILGPLGILNPPDEIILRVFDYVKPPFFEPLDPTASTESLPNHFFGEEEEDTHTTQNARLTCRRFYKLISPQLINYICLTPQTYSLECLQGIAQHPVIRRGLRRVNVCPPLYPSELEDSFDDFIRGECLVGMENKQNRKYINRVYNLYRSRYKDQQWLLESRQFVRETAATLAHMPSVETLVFNCKECAFCGGSHEPSFRDYIPYGW